ISFIDYAREIIMVATRENAGHEQIIAASRLSKIYGTDMAEFTILIGDDWQGKGLGTEILQRQIEIARAEGIRRIQAEVLPEADAMRHIFQKFGFEVEPDSDEETMTATLYLEGS